MKMASINVYYQNVRGLRTKTHTFYRKLCCSNYDLIILTETWLNKSVLNSELFDDRYVIYRRDRDTSNQSVKRDGGGVLVAVSKTMSSHRENKWESDAEDLWVTINVQNSNLINPYTFCAVYLPPPVSKTSLNNFLVNCNCFLEQTNNFTCIVGDFNLGCIKWSLLGSSSSSNTAQPQLHLTTLEHLLVEFSNTNNLSQNNNIINSMGRVLDLVFTDVPQCHVLNSIDPLSNVDPLHPPLYIKIQTSVAKTLLYNSVKRYNFNKSNYVEINKELDKIDWQESFQCCNNVDAMVDIFYKNIWDAITQYTPVVKPQRKNKPPWFTPCLIRCLREKHKIRQRYNIYKNPLDELVLIKLNKRCDRLSIECYNKYIKNTELNIKNNPKYFWSYLKDKRGGSSTYPTSLTDGKTLATNGTDICNLFAKYFSSVYSITPEFNFSDANNLFDQLVNNGDCFSSLYLDKPSIYKKIKTLNTSKGPGSDGIPPIFVVSCAINISTPLYIIFNKSLSTGIFPLRWKTAKVVPIFKSDDIKHVTNYRPISILSVFGKILESLVCPYVLNYFKTYLTEHQHGFVHKRSTGSNLITFTDLIVNALDRGTQVDVVYTDFSKAFDKVSHPILMHKLAHYGFAGNLLEWIGSYLKNRSFYVVVTGFQSSVFQIGSGVPQGSHLGPILFNIFINDLPCCLNYSIPFLFADDLKILREINTIVDISLLQNDIDSLTAWCHRNQMQLNAKKCHFIKFTRKLKVTPSSYHIEQNILNEAETVRDLGVILDKKCTFIPHMDSIIQKASRLLGFVMRNVKVFKKPTSKILIYNALVRSQLEYCSIIWRPHYSTHMLRIERLQKRFLWHLANSTGVATKIRSYQDRLKHFRIMSLTKRRILLDLVFSYKILRNEIDCPQLLNKFKLKIPHRYPRYAIKPFAPPLRRTALGINSPIPRLCRILNEYNDKIEVFGDSSSKFRKDVISFLDSI